MTTCLDDEALADWIEREEDGPEHLWTCADCALRLAQFDTCARSMRALGSTPRDRSPQTGSWLGLAVAACALIGIVTYIVRGPRAPIPGAQQTSEEDGTRFEAPIPEFTLSVPRVLH